MYTLHPILSGVTNGKTDKIKSSPKHTLKYVGLKEKKMGAKVYNRHHVKKTS